MVYEWCELSSISSSRLAQAASQLPHQRYEKAAAHVREDDRRASVCAWALLQHALKHELGERGRQLASADARIATGRFGKPYFPDAPDVCFNLSHASGAVMCVLSDAPVGCDVEPVHTVREITPEVEERVLHAHERRLLASFAPAQHLRAFSLLWVIKEAYTKQSGCGLTQDVTVLDASEVAAAYLQELASPPAEPQPLTYEFDPLFLTLYERGRHALCACSPTPLPRAAVPTGDPNGEHAPASSS